MTDATQFEQIDGLKKYCVEDIGSIISSAPGIYIWWDKAGVTPVYIGRALNKRGLLGRVVKQHLCPTYLELRKHITEKASMVSMYKGRRAAEKSVFRKKISLIFQVLPGAPCVDFITANFLVSLLSLPTTEQNDIKQIERHLIDIHDPLYNTSK